MRQNFIEPLLHLQSKDLKEVAVSGILYVFYCHHSFILARVKIMSIQY